MNQQIMLLLLPLMTSILLKGSQKKLDVKNAIQYSNEKCLISVTMRSLAELANVTIDSDSATRNTLNNYSIPNCVIINSKHVGRSGSIM